MTTYANQRHILDADSHLMELPDFLDAHANPEERALLPNLADILLGQFEPQFDPTTVTMHTGHSPAHRATLDALGANVTKGPKWHQALGAFSSPERSEALNRLGFHRQVVFSSFCARLIFAASNDNTAYAAAAAHNRAMATFCGDDPRLLGVAMVPLQDVDRALSEVDRAVQLGLRAVWIAADAPGGRSPGHTAHDAIWQRLSDAKVPFILHVGSSDLAVGDAWLNDGRNTVTARGGAEVIGSKDLTAIHFGALQFVSALVLDGVLERFPELRVGVIELGAGWVPDMIRRLDYAADIWSRSEPHLRTFRRKPSEQIAQQLRFTPYPFENVAQLVNEADSRLFMFSSDYPHAEGGRDPLGRFQKTTNTLTQADQERFYATNCAQLYGLRS